MRANLWGPRGAGGPGHAYFHRYQQTILFDDTGDVARDLTTQMTNLIGAFRGRAGAIMAELIGRAQTDQALSDTLWAVWLSPRREASTAVIRLAIDRGQVRPDVDIPALLDQLYAPLYFRLLMRHEPLEEGLADTLVSVALAPVRP